MSGLTRSEKLHKLLIEVAHADLWKDPEVARYGWCWSIRVVGKEPTQNDYSRLLDHCYFCTMDGGDFCLIEWGLLMDDPLKLKRQPMLHFGTPSGGINTGAFYNRHYNIISIDGSWPFNRDIENDLERLVNHETLHWVLLKLFPSKDVYERYDNVAREAEESDIEAGN